MCRLLPIYKDGFFLKSVLVSRSCPYGVKCISNLPNRSTRAIDIEVLFNACTTAEVVKRVHTLLIVSGKAQSSFVRTRLVNLYAHLGDLTASQITFHEISNKDANTWNSMVSAYVRNRQFHKAVKCVLKMLAISDVKPDFYTFPPVLKACRSLQDGSRFHCWVLKLGFEWDVYVAASLVHMYCRLGYADSGFTIFKAMPCRDMGCWNAVISGFVQNGSAEEALNILEYMKMEGVDMDSVTVSTILSVCAQMNYMLLGLLIHSYAIKHGLELNVFVSNALINMYAKFGELECALNVFNNMDGRDLVSWNSIIAAFEQNNCPFDVQKLFILMQSYKTEPDSLTLVSLCSSFAQTKDILSAKSAHGFTTRRYWVVENGSLIGNAVVDMYAKLCLIESAKKVFDELAHKDVISWNTIITGYAENGFAAEAIEVYNKMSDVGGVTRNQGTWVSVLPACAHLGALRDGTRIHCQALKECLDLDVFVGTCLVDLYGKCGKLNEALALFYEVPRELSVPWNAIISCHGLHGLGETSIQLFNDMLNEGVDPDQVTFLSLLTACSHSGLVDQGKAYFHMMEKEFGIRPTVKHYGCIVDLFGRAGLLETAYDFIINMPMKPDATVWGALLGACRIHGNVEMGRKALKNLFDLDPENVGYYVLASNLYANFRRWENVEKVRSLVRGRGLSKTPGWSSVDMNNKVEVFYTGNQTHPQSEVIYKELAILTAKLKTLGYTPDHSFVLQDVEDDEKESILTSHCERQAIMYAILNSPEKTGIRIYKNLRVCGDCHSLTKLISKYTEREITVRDSNRFHVFRDGVCSCGDYW